MVYDKTGRTLLSIYNSSGRSLDYGYDKNGKVIFQKYVPDELTEYEVFYPSDARNTYEVDEGRKLKMTASQFLAIAYDDYVSNPPEGIVVNKNLLGKDSTGTYDIWEYDFNPTDAKRKILLMSGEHAYETTAQFGLAHLIYHIYRIDDNPAFAYIRKNVRIKIIPICNPWGASQYPKEYPVYGGINPERNFAYNELWEEFTSSGNYWNKKGEHPFQTAETRIHAKWIMVNQDADFFINCHTGETDYAYDNWIDYMRLTPVYNALMAGLGRNEEEFLEKFGSVSRTHKVETLYPNDTGYGMHDMFLIRCCKMPCFTMEQAPHNTIFGNGMSNSPGGINNYASVTCTYLLEFLLDKYQPIYDSLHPNDSVPVTGVSGENVTLAASDYSKTVTLTMTPSDTSQFNFDWVSSDPLVCEVWGCTDQAVIVKRGAGTATITVTNRLNPSVSTSFTVTASQLT